MSTQHLKEDPISQKGRKRYDIYVENMGEGTLYFSQT